MSLMYMLPYTLRTPPTCPLALAHISAPRRSPTRISPCPPKGGIRKGGSNKKAPF